MILKFNKFLENNSNKVEIYFYAFDFDDNILNMPTEIIVKSDDGSEIGMSTSDFAIFRSKLGKESFLYKGENIIGLDYSTAFRNFRDENDPEIFKKDVSKAIENRSYGPAWDDFIECLTNGSLFAIITARGHESEGMRKGIEFIIDNLSDVEKNKMNDSLLMYKHLFDDNSNDIQYNISNFSKSVLVSSYLDICHFVGVSSPSRGGSPDNPEVAKEDALRIFISDVNDYAKKVGYDAKVGFSDDDPGNISHMTKVLSSKDINHEDLWPYISEFTIKDTNKPNDIISTKIPTRIEKFDNFK